MMRGPVGWCALVLWSGLPAPVRAAPDPAPHWEPAGWGGGGFFWAALFDPRGNGTLTLGGDVAGIYKSDSRGLRWRFINRGLGNYAVYALAQCAGEPDYLYAMTEHGVCRSDDAGESWRPLARTAPDALNITARRGETVRALAVHPRNPKTVWAGGPTGKLYRTVDGGESWLEIAYGRNPEAAGREGAVASIVLGVRDPARILVAHRTQGVFVSRDGGATWRHALVRPGAFTVAFDPSRATAALAGFEGGKVFRSSDGGLHWADGSAGLPAHLAIREIVVDPRHGARVNAIGSGNWAGWFCQSTDGGAHWTVTRPALKIDPIGNPTLPEDPGSRDLSTPTNLCVNPHNPDEMFISCNWRNAYTSDGGKTWEERSRGADISVVTDLRFAGGKTYAVAMDEGLLESADQGASWRQLCPTKWMDSLSGHHWRVSIREDGGRTTILSTVSPWNGQFPNRVVRSDDGGKSFETFTAGLPACVPAGNTMWGRSYPRALARDPGNPSFIYMGMDGDPDPANPACAGGFFKSADGGTTWTSPKSQPGSRRIFYGLAADPQAPGRVYWGACGTGGGVYRSDDRGERWIKVFDKEQWIFNVHVTASGTVLAAGTQLWESRNAGKTWKVLTNFTDGCTTVGLEVDPGNEQRIWISRVTWDANARGGIHRSINGGRSWEDITGDIPYVKPLVLRFDSATDTLWAGGAGIFKIRQ